MGRGFVPWREISTLLEVTRCYVSLTKGHRSSPSPSCVLALFLVRSLRKKKKKSWRGAATDVIFDTYLILSKISLWPKVVLFVTRLLLLLLLFLFCLVYCPFLSLFILACYNYVWSSVLYLLFIITLPYCVFASFMAQSLGPFFLSFFFSIFFLRGGYFFFWGGRGGEGGGNTNFVDLFTLCIPRLSTSFACFFGLLLLTLCARFPFWRLCNYRWPNFLETVVLLRP